MNFKSSSQQQKDNLFATENEENEIAETRLSGDVEGKSVVIIHDVIDTGRQLKRAVEVFKSIISTISVLLSSLDHKIQ